MDQKTDFMTETEKQLLNTIQSDFPLASRPFKELATKLGISENEVIDLMEDLKQRKIIRRVGAIFDLQKLGYKSTLCAIKAPPQRLDEIAEIVNSYSGVTHNYGRENEFNLWFTLIAKNREELSRLLKEIKEKAGVDMILDLPAINLYKIRVDFKL